MNRKYPLLVVSLLGFLLSACGPHSPANEEIGTRFALEAATIRAGYETATAEVRTATARAAFEKTTIALAGGGQQTTTPTATPTHAQPPSATPTSTAKPAPSATATEEPPVPKIGSVCNILDNKVLGSLLGVNIVRSQEVTQKDGSVRCYWTSADAAAGVTLEVAQDNIAVNLDVSMYAELDAVKNCAKPVPVGRDFFQKALDDLEKLVLSGITLVRQSYTRDYTLIQDKGCTDQYGVQAIPGLGDAAYADHVYGYQRVGAVYRNTITNVYAYNTGMTPSQAMPIEEKVAAEVIMRVAPK